MQNDSSIKSGVLHMRRVQVRHALYFAGYFSYAGVLYLYARSLQSSSIFLWTVIIVALCLGLMSAVVFILTTVRVHELMEKRVQKQSTNEDQPLIESSEFLMVNKEHEVNEGSQRD